MGVSVALPPEQNDCVSVAFVTVGVGSTVTTKLLGVPGQFVGAGPIGVIV